MESRPASTASSAQLAEVWNAAFSDYVGGSVNFNAETVSLWFSKNFISLPRSHVFFLPSEPDKLIAFCLIAIRDDKPGESRIPMMGVVPSARGGTGSRAVNEVIRAEKAHGTKLIELECIQNNPLGLNLWKRKGFTILREIPGWERDAPPAGEFASNSELQDCSIGEVDLLVQKHGAKDLAWQAWGFGPRATPKTRAFKLGHAYCVVSDPRDKEEDTVTMHSLFVDPEWRLKGEATKLVKAMMGNFPGMKWEASPIFAKEYGDGIARRLGFREDKSKQYQMRLTLD